MQHIQRLDRFAVADYFFAHMSKCGEQVWDQRVVDSGMVYAMPFALSSWLATRFSEGVFASGDPEEWMGSISSDGLRLFSREGEWYDDAGRQYFRDAVSVVVRDTESMMSMCIVKRVDLWQARFVCPYCKRVCHWNGPCEHVVVMDGVAVPGGNGTLAKLVRLMSQRSIVCNTANLLSKNVFVKVARRHYSNEWFRCAYWYVRNKSGVKELVRALEREAVRAH